MGARALNLVAVGLASVPSAVLALVPPPTDAGPAWLAALLAFPVLVTAVPLALGRRARVIAAVVLGVATLVAAASIGLFYVPAASALAGAAGLGWGPYSVPPL
jgi:hypothetical protein